MVPLHRRTFRSVLIVEGLSVAMLTVWQNNFLTYVYGTLESICVSSTRMSISAGAQRKSQVMSTRVATDIHITW